MATVENNGLIYNRGYDFNSKKIKSFSNFCINENLPQKLTISEFMAKYRDEIDYPIHKTDVKRICDRIGSLDLKEITHKILVNFHQRIATETTLKFTAREHLHRVICEIFKLATELEYIAINPTFRTFKYEQKQDKVKQTADIKTIRKLVKCLERERPKHKLFYSLIIATGLNRAEVAQLKWCDVDFKKRQIKNISLSKNIIEKLNNLKQNDGYIFSQPNGKAMCPSSFTYRLNLLRKKYDLEGITMHKIQNTVTNLLKTMSYAQIQRKVEL